MIKWLVLTASLPSTSSGLRMRIWRKLRGTHCASLREGVYILPSLAPTADSFLQVDKAIREAGVDAYLLEVNARDHEQETSFRRLFDRSDQYSEFSQALRDGREAFKTMDHAGIRSTLRSLDTHLQSIVDTDFFPAAMADSVRAGMRALRLEAERFISPDEPSPTSAQVTLLDPKEYQSRVWATRARPWADRLATAWLVSRFIDRSPKFVWFTNVGDCADDALGYDFDGATFTHTADFVTFEVVAVAFSLYTDPCIRRIGEIVHFIDVGGISADEAPGIELTVRGLQATHTNDNELLAAALTLFDAIYQGLQAKP